MLLIAMRNVSENSYSVQFKFNETQKDYLTQTLLILSVVELKKINSYMRRLNKFILRESFCYRYFFKYLRLLCIFTENSNLILLFFFAEIIIFLLSMKDNLARNNSEKKYKMKF